MRSELDKRADKTVKYRATFCGFGNTPSAGRKVLLKDVYVGKQLVADHVWVDYEPDLQMIAAYLITNQTVIEFYAVAKTYTKDPSFRETGSQHKLEVDYTLRDFRHIEIKVP
jgi:hypothetical protein